MWLTQMLPLHKKVCRAISDPNVILSSTPYLCQKKICAVVYYSNFILSFIPVTMVSYIPVSGTYITNHDKKEFLLHYLILML